MAKNKVKRYPKNVVGPFYVENGMCISCGAPEDVAPNLMAHEEEGESINHCYFKKQPSTKEEYEQAIDAIRSSCCGAVNYDGDDPEILQRLAEIEKQELSARIKFNELQEKLSERLKNSSYALSKRKLPK